VIDPANDSLIFTSPKPGDMQRGGLVIAVANDKLLLLAYNRFERWCWKQEWSSWVTERMDQQEVMPGQKRV
jgi:hypothetical protein